MSKQHQFKTPDQLGNRPRSICCHCHLEVKVTLGYPCVMWYQKPGGQWIVVGDAHPLPACVSADRQRELDAAVSLL